MCAAGRRPTCSHGLLCFSSTPVCSAVPWVTLPHGHLHSWGWPRSTESFIPALPWSCRGLQHHCSHICLFSWFLGLCQAGLTQQGLLRAACPHRRGCAQASLGGKRPSHMASCAQHLCPWRWTEALMVLLISVLSQVSSAGSEPHQPCVPHFHLHPGAVPVPQTTQGPREMCPDLPRPPAAGPC